MASKKIRIMTDSVADIPQTLLDEYNIGVVPCYVNYGGESYADDGEQLSRTHFYQYITDNNEVPTTAAPSIGDSETILRDALEGYDHLISVNVARTLSTTANNVQLACNEVDPSRMTVIDSESVSMGIGWLALIAAEVARETGDVDAVVEAVERAKKATTLYAGIYNMEFLRRSGRVNTVVASIGSLLQIKPIVQVIENGEVISAHRVRTFKRVKSKLRDLLEEMSGNLDRVAIIHTADIEAAHQFKKDNADLLPENTIITEVGPTLGTHIGPKSLGFVPVMKSWKA
ncbi:MAG: DegV family protein [Chloroflexota bacterium]